MRSRVAVAGLLVILAMPATADATAPGENGKVAFTSGETFSSGDIHTVWPSADPNQRQETNLTLNPGLDMDPAWSPDGTKLAYASSSSSSDPTRIWVMNEDGSGKTQLTPDGTTRDDFSPTWSADGSRVAWIRRRSGDAPCDEIFVINADGTNPASLGPGPACPFFVILNDVDWSPDGTKLAYTYDYTNVFVANADNTEPERVGLFPTAAPSWSPAGTWIAYERDDNVGATVLRVTPDDSFGGPFGYRGRQPDWSPDGRMIVARSGLEGTSDLLVREEGAADPAADVAIAGNATDPDWQPRPPFVTPPGYPRPKGAGPLDVALVPAHEQCFEPNSTHGAPLSFGSCGPPVQSSSILTVGTPDANGQGARAVGHAVFKPLLGDEGTPQDEADVQLAVSLTDVRCREGGIPGCDSALGDYGGSVREVFDLTVTDKNNGGSNAESATGKSFPYFAPALQIIVPCVPTADPAIGARCAVETTIEALAGNAIAEGKRTTWAIGDVQLWDPGADGNHGAVDDNTLFARQGLFVP
jgi:WD40 repeat protein